MNLESLKKSKKRNKVKVNNVRIDDSNYIELQELSRKEKVSIVKLTNFIIQEGLKQLKKGG